MFIDLNPQKLCLQVATTISFGMAGAHEPAFVWWPVLPLFPVLPHKYFYYHGSRHPPHPNGMRLLSYIILWSLWRLSPQSAPLCESYSWQSYCWQKTAIGYAAKHFVVYVNFNGDPKYLPFVVWILDFMTVTYSHLLPLFLLLYIILFLRLGVSCLLARIVLPYAQAKYLLSPICFYPIFLLMAKVPLPNILWDHFDKICNVSGFFWHIWGIFLVGSRKRDCKTTFVWRMQVYSSPSRILNNYMQHILQMLLIIQGQLQYQDTKKSRMCPNE